jgi:hypothetical protein
VATVQCTFCMTYNVDPGPHVDLSHFACGYCHHPGTLVRLMPGVVGAVGPVGPPAPANQDQAVATGMMGAAIGGSMAGPVGFVVGAVLGAMVGYKRPPGAAQ